MIGGAKVFALFRDQLDRVELAEVHCGAIGDARMPGFDGRHEVAREDHAAEGEQPAFSFVTLVREGSVRRFEAEPSG